MTEMEEGGCVYFCVGGGVDDDWFEPIFRRTATSFFLVFFEINSGFLALNCWIIFIATSRSVNGNSFVVFEQMGPTNSC